MRFTHLFTRTLRTDPAEAETPSHRLMLKAGFIHQLASGFYTYLPLAWRALRKIETIIRQEMDAAGGQELRMPSLHPQELWEVTNRRATFGDGLFSLVDRRERPMVLAPTHEEVVTTLVRQFVQSYRDIPLILYQIQTKFRDELRPRGGLIRVREFDMKDAYSFDSDWESLDQSYQLMIKAYQNIYSRCGLTVIQAEADSGAIGGKDSHEFMLPTVVGEDTIIHCPNCSHAANTEKARSVKSVVPAESIKPIVEIHTPGTKTIAELCGYLKLPPEKTLKVVFYIADEKTVIVILRGDADINEIKLKHVLGCNALRLADEREVQQAGFIPGFASLIGIEHTEVTRVADESISLTSNCVAGGNRLDYHFGNVNYPRDFTVDMIADIALAEQGDGCIYCGYPVEILQGIEIGHVFKLGTFFSDHLGATYLDKSGKQRPLVMGCYGIGIGRLLAAAIEQHHDDKGIIFPPSISPYQVYLAGLNGEIDVARQAATDLYGHLQKRGIDVLYDDRDESPGVKLKDSDLLGFPIRVIVSSRTLKEHSAEIKCRQDEKPIIIPINEVSPTIERLLREWPY